MKRINNTTKRLRKTKPVIIFLVAIIVVLVSGVGIIRKVYNDSLKPVGASQRGQTVTIPLGSSAHQIAVMLKDAGVIRQSWAFEWYIRNHDLRDKLQAGSYFLRQNQGVQQIVFIITNGQVATDLVTILPAQRLDQIRSALISSGFSAKDVESALNPANYRDHPALVDKPKSASLEGYLYPDSFQKDSNTTAGDIIRASLDEMQQHLTPVLRAAIVRQGLTVHQGVILASIVEQEVSKTSDKPIVAQVFLKRLRDHMVLGSDVTVIYGSLIAGKGADLTYDSPYNTHIHQGLPPGPISNVSASSLNAVAYPAHSSYLYFVAGDDGVTYFSKTLQEHETLTREHCKKLCGL